MSTSADRLVYMANQIAGFFVTQPGADAAARIADHINAFWDPAMRRGILALVAQGGEGLTPPALAAVRLLDQASPATVQRMAESGGHPSPGHTPGDDAG